MVVIVMEVLMVERSGEDELMGMMGKGGIWKMMPTCKRSDVFCSNADSECLSRGTR